MSGISTHYSLGQRPQELAEWAEKSASQLNKYARVPLVFCYRGMSGVAHATALMLAYAKYDKPFRMIYVRKDQEPTHGNTFSV